MKGGDSLHIHFYFGLDDNYDNYDNNDRKTVILITCFFPRRRSLDSRAFFGLFVLSAVFEIDAIIGSFFMATLPCVFALSLTLFECNFSPMAVKKLSANK